MDSAEREELEAFAHKIGKASRMRAIITGVVAAFTFMILQTVFILLGARLTSMSNQSLVDRVDRNATFTACVLSIDVDTRKPSDVDRCLDRANLRFDTGRAPDDPRLLSPWLP